MCLQNKSILCKTVLSHHRVQTEECHFLYVMLFKVRATLAAALRGASKFSLAELRRESEESRTGLASSSSNQGIRSCRSLHWAFSVFFFFLLLLHWYLPLCASSPFRRGWRRSGGCAVSPPHDLHLDDPQKQGVPGSPGGTTWPSPH